MRSAPPHASGSPRAYSADDAEAPDQTTEPDLGAAHSLPTIFSGLPLEARDHMVRSHALLVSPVLSTS